MQVAAMGLLDAIRDYDFNSGCKLLTLAVFKIRKLLHTRLTAFKQQKRSGVTISLNATLPDTNGVTFEDSLQAENEPTEGDYIPDLMKCCATIQNRKKRAVIAALIEQFAYSEISLVDVGNKFNLSRERVRQIKEQVAGEGAFQQFREELRAA